MEKQKIRNRCKGVTYIVVLYLIFILAVGANKFLSFDHLSLKSNKVDLYIPTGSNFDDVVKILLKEKILKEEAPFRRSASLYGFNTVKSGHYIVKNGMKLNQLVKMLSTGQQVPVNMVIAGNIREKEKLAGIVARQVEADSLTLLQLLNDKDFLKPLGFSPANSMLLFLPNTYNVYWNRSPKRLLEDMKLNYDRFWTDARLKKLKEINLTKEEVMTLASIVIEESNKTKEQPTIAGVYINRIKKQMPLQADPTVKFAVGDFTLRRVLNVHTAYDSPYNTYKNLGLPPGPICIPQISAIDAVLNYEKHDYLYFCAKSDMSGYHAFAKTLDQHNVNANEYRNALNKLKIYK